MSGISVVVDFGREVVKVNMTFKKIYLFYMENNLYTVAFVCVYINAIFCFHR